MNGTTHNEQLKANGAGARMEKKKKSKRSNVINHEQTNTISTKVRRVLICFRFDRVRANYAKIRLFGQARTAEWPLCDCTLYHSQTITFTFERCLSVSFTIRPLFFVLRLFLLTFPASRSLGSVFSIFTFIGASSSSQPFVNGGHFKSTSSAQ